MLLFSVVLLAGCGKETMEVKVMEINWSGETVEKIIEVTQEEAERVAEEAWVTVEDIMVVKDEVAGSWEISQEVSAVNADSSVHWLKTNARLWKTGVDESDLD